MKEILDLTKLENRHNSMAQVLRILRDNQMQITDQIIKDLIINTKKRRSDQMKAYLAYKADKLPIKEKESKRADEINNKLNNDFRGDIVDTMQGYVFGEPIVYSIRKNGEDAKESAEDRNLQELSRVNNFPDLDSETGKKMGICGYGVREIVVRRDGGLRFYDVPPWETIFIKDSGLLEDEIAIRLYKIDVRENDGTFSKRWRVIWYGNKQIVFYVQNKEGKFILDETEPDNPRPNLLGRVNLIKFPNNQEELNDFDKVVSLIDGYDRVVSYNQDELEALRNAYLVLKLAELDPEEAKKIKDTGTIELTDKDSEAGFLTKDLTSDFVDAHLNRLEQNIYKFSKTPNYLDKEFQAATGVALRYRLLPLENKAIVKERKFTAALRKQFDVIEGYLQKINKKIPAKDLEFSFTRSLPVDLKSEAEATNQLMGTVSEETRLSQLSFVQNPKQEIEKMAKDKKNNIDLEKDSGIFED